VAAALGLLLLGGAAAARAEQALPRTTQDEDLVYERLHEGGEREKAALRAYERVEDDAASDGRALGVRLNKQLVRAGDFPVLRTPALDASEPLPVGTYRVTIRMKVRGMLNSLGSSVLLKAGDNQREIWMNEFEEEDAYQTFSFRCESRPGDLVSLRDEGMFFTGVERDRAGIVPPSEIEKLRERRAWNKAPWRERFVRHFARTAAEKPDQIEPLKERLRGRLGEGFSEEAFPEDSALAGLKPTALNARGASRPDGRVKVTFPKNTTGTMEATRGASTPQPTLRRLFVDWVKLERVEPPDHIVMRSVRPRYPWRRSGQTQRFGLWMHNRSGKKQSATAQVVLHTGLDGEHVVHAEEVALADGDFARLEPKWTVPEDHPHWGQRVEARVVEDGEVMSRAHGYFTVHPWSNAIYIGGRSNTRRWRHPYAEPPRAWTVKQYPGASGSQWDSAGVIPEEENLFRPYPSGQGGLWWSVTNYQWKALTHQYHGRGYQFYLQVNGSAERAFEIYWNHPSWVPRKVSNSDNFLIKRRESAKRFRKWANGEIETENGEPPEIARSGGAYAGFLVPLNGIVEENVDRVIEDVIRLLDHAPINAVRWDGLPFTAYNNKSIGGTYGKTQEELDQISAENVRRFKREVRAEHPRFEFAANAGMRELHEKQPEPRNIDAAWQILRDNEHLVALLEDHGQVEEEIWESYGAYGDYRNRALGYLRAAFFDAAAQKRAGGHTRHMMWFKDNVQQYTPDEVYQQVFSLVAGAQLERSWGPIVESRHDLGVYAMRFGAFFWDPKLRAIPNLGERIEADTDARLWYTEAGHQKKLEDGRLLQVIPVINPPVTERWLRNRFGTLPEPIEQPIGFQLARPEGYAGAEKVALLANEPRPQVKPLDFQMRGGELHFAVPGIEVFEVVAVTWRPKEEGA
jgi:hypothetical protein